MSESKNERIRLARLAELGVTTASLLHELRQPLFAIQATAELALRAGGEGATRWQGVLQQARHMEQLLGRYGGLQRTSGRAETFDLREAVAAAVDMLGHRASRLGVTLHAEPFSAPVRVDAVRGAVRQIAVNLIQNALDAVEPHAGSVRVRTAVDGDHAVLVVSDDGPGLPEDKLEAVFDPFVSSKPPDQGTGLGLYIVRLLVDEASGDITIDSTDGRGVVVTVRLPHTG